MRHDETRKLEIEPRQDIQVSRLRKDPDMKNHVSTLEAVYTQDTSRESITESRIWKTKVSSQIQGHVELQIHRHGQSRSL